MVLAIGIILFFWDDIDLIIKRFRLRHRLKALRIEEKELPKILEYCSHLIDVSFNNESAKRFFIIAEGFLFVIAYLLSYKNFSMFAALFVAFMSISFPIIILVVRLESLRAKSSKEGISLVTELHRQYCISNKNIYEAINNTIKQEADYKYSVNSLYKLLLSIRTDNNPINLKDSIKVFVFSFGTNWAKMLGQCIYLSAYNGIDISAGLIDIIDQLKEAYNLNQRRKMLNGEASRMTLFLIPIMYIVCMLVAKFYLNIPFSSLFVNQFLNPTGFLLFLINIFLFLINVMLIYLSNSGRLDF